MSMGLGIPKDTERCLHRSRYWQCSPVIEGDVESVCLAHAGDIVAVSSRVTG